MCEWYNRYLNCVRGYTINILQKTIFFMEYLILSDICIQMSYDLRGS